MHLLHCSLDLLNDIATIVEETEKWCPYLWICKCSRCTICSQGSQIINRLLTLCINTKCTRKNVLINITIMFNWRDQDLYCMQVTTFTNTLVFSHTIQKGLSPRDHAWFVCTIIPLSKQASLCVQVVQCRIYGGN